MTRNDHAFIRKTAKVAASETLKALQEKSYIRITSAYKKTETLLYAYPALELHIKEMQKDIKDVRREGVKRKSDDIINYSSQANSTPPEELDERILKKIQSIKKTRTEIRRIKRALIKVKGDNYYKLVKDFYFGYEKKEQDPDHLTKLIDVHTTYTIKEISIRYNMTESTVKRQKSRLVNLLSTILFGEESLN